MTTPEQWLNTCPLCGADNQCAVASGQPVETCWCAATVISADALAATPAESVGKRCLCPACGRTKGDMLDER